MPNFRALLSAAQQAEIRGDKAEAIRLLREAATAYRDRDMPGRALQMLRQIRRLEGVPIDELMPLDAVPDEDTVTGARPDPRVPPGDELGFGDSLLPDGGLTTDGRDDRDEGGGAPRRTWVLSDDEEDEAPISRRRIGRTLVEQRGPSRADPAIDAWCSFCCRPKLEVGALIAGPAGAFICASCVRASTALLDGDAAPPPSTPPSPPISAAAQAPPKVSLPAQAAARARLERAQPKLALVIGPEGSGKSSLLRTLGPTVEPPLERLAGDLVVLDLTAPLSAADEARLLRWLDEHPQRRAILAARGAVPRPVLVLKGEHGDEPVFDTAALSESVTHLSPAGLARVDAVLPLAAPDRPALEALARALLELRGVSLAEEAVAQLVDIAEKAGRGAHELAALIARIPPGRYAP
ncbi:MAG: ClpX C4-type zinc finger protein [Myxococcota bacterium]